MIPFSEAFGGSNGTARRLTPSVRLMCGALVFACCATVPLDSQAGISLFVGVWLAWLLICAMKPKRFALTLGFALCLFAPFLLLAPVAHWKAAAANWTEALRAPLRLGVRGIAGVTVCSGALSVLSLAEFCEAAAGLPLPRVVTGLLVQIVHQTALLTDESRRMADALRVRGAPSARLAVRLRVVAALPAGWLARLVMHAARVGDAMEVRGFDGWMPAAQAKRLSGVDRVALASTAMLAVGALMLRWRGSA